MSMLVRGSLTSHHTMRVPEDCEIANVESISIFAVRA